MSHVANRLTPIARLLSWVLLLTVVMNASLSVGQSEKDNRCEEITIPMCRGIGYNLTFMPNLFNHDTQEEAGLEVHQFWPLVEIKCSSDLKFFLCSMYAPICMEDYHQPLPACRSVCERARTGCAPLMRKYGFAWPERMNCEKLPEYGDSQRLCMDSKNGSDVEKTTSSSHPKQRPATERSRNPTRAKNSSHGARVPPFGDTESPTAPKRPFLGISTSIDDGSGSGGPTVHCDCDCHPPMIRIQDTGAYFNRVVTGNVDNCALPCSGPFASDNERTFTKFWIGLWSILCCISTTMTISTFLIDMQRFKYPERPIIFLSGCLMMVSIGYVIPVALGPSQVACDGPIVRPESTGPATCTVVFLLVYFFGMASSIWWVILAFTWFLAAGLKWGNEAIASYSQYFHLAAWLVPSVKSIAVLATSSVDGDPVSGICFVGNHNLNNLRGFVLAPLVAYLLLGTSFLLAGFVSLFRIRNVIKQQGRNKTEKLEKLMMRIGIFSVLYTVPAVIIIGCYLYEQHFRSAWQRAITCPCDADFRPDYSVFMLKYFMCLGVGITSGAWIWSGKTFESWRRFYVNLCPHRDSTYHGQNTVRTLKPASVHSVNHGHLQKQLPLSHV